jgi:hypothetical protein
LSHDKSRTTTRQTQSTTGSSPSGIEKGKAIQSFIGQEDHVKAIKDHFLNLLKEVEEFTKDYKDYTSRTHGKSLPEIQTET